jgi:nickel/cobalt transporter (NiCoT) family protein
MQEGKRPISTGFFFALGHSSVVIIASLIVAVSVGALQSRFAEFKEVGGLIGTGISATFLLVIALINTMILMSVYRAFMAVRRGERLIEEDLHDLLDRRGLFARMPRSLFAVITRSWHMFPLGFLFGLGFDTASEVGLLVISAAQGSAGLPIWSILVFPALFAAGMSLIDTTGRPASGRSWTSTEASVPTRVLFSESYRGFMDCGGGGSLPLRLWTK